jgi:hypothetical protein
MFEAEQDLKEWRADALRLAEALRLIVNRCGDDNAPLHVGSGDANLGRRCRARCARAA